VQASIDRIVIAAVDIILGANLADHPDVTPLPDEALDADADAIVAALTELLGSADFHVTPTADLVTWTAIGRLFEWGRTALVALDRGHLQQHGLELRVPSTVRGDIVRDVVQHTVAAHEDHPRGESSAASGGQPWGTHTWWALVEQDATPLDLVWSAAVLTAELAWRRRSEDPEATGGLAMVLDGLGASMFGGLLAWEQPGDVVVRRPHRYGLRALFDPGSGVLLWQSTQTSIDRWDYAVDHFDLPIPLSLASRVQYLVVRYDRTIEGYRVAEELPWGPGELEQFERDYQAVCDDLERALGSAYSIDGRSRP
jgi:hypothetical protein